MPERAAHDVLHSVLDRPALVTVLRDGRFDRHDIECHLDVSRSTAHRVVHDLRDNDIIARTDGAYKLTPFGEVVIDESERCRTTVDTALAIRPLLEVADSNDHPIPIESFADAEITGPNDPTRRIEERLVESVSTATRIRCASKTVVGHRFLAAIFDHMDSGAAVDVVSTDEAIEFVRTTHPAVPEFEAVPENVELSITDTIPFFITITDASACVGAYGSEALRIDMLVESDDPHAVEWAEDVFETLKADATPHPCDLASKETPDE